MAEKAITQLRIDDNIYQKVKYIAQRELRSTNNQLDYFIQKGINDYEKEHGKISILPEL